MKNLAALSVLNQTTFDSGALSGLGAVAHQVKTTGSHRVTVFQGNKAVSNLPLLVQQPSPVLGAAATAAVVPAALHINIGDFLNKLGQLMPRTPSQNLEIPAQGYVVFQAPPGIEGYAVQLQAANAPPQQPGFDSRELQNGDIYTATILRPGRYAVTNSITGAKADLRVEYPVVGDKPYTPPDALNVQLTDKGFDPNSIQLKPAQGLIFRIGNTRARIQINLVEPDDGPAGGKGVAPAQSAPLHRWVNPAPDKTDT